MSKNKKYMFSSFNKSDSPLLNKYISSINSSCVDSVKTIKKVKKMTKKTVQAIAATKVGIANGRCITDLKDYVDGKYINLFIQDSFFTKRLVESIGVYTSLYTKQRGEKSSLFSVTVHPALVVLSKRDKLRMPSILELFVITLLNSEELQIDLLKKTVKMQEINSLGSTIKLRLPKVSVCQLKHVAKQARVSYRSLLLKFIHLALKLT